MAKDENDTTKKPPGIPAKPDPKVKAERCAKCWERPCGRQGKCAPRDPAK